ncbi:MAG: hypothetical protein HY259_13000 [Chloroflexi bacterium]|nr:hypothetical protein [Chloroflexota bacterium]
MTYSHDDGDRRLQTAEPPRPPARVLDVPALTQPTTNIGNLQTQVQQIQALTAAPVSRSLRRLVFVWLRIFVYENKRGKESKVNIAIPLPIPVIGAVFRRHLGLGQALKALSLAQSGPNGFREVESYVDSCMGLEFIRVEEISLDREKRELVVIGLD